MAAVLGGDAGDDHAVSPYGAEDDLQIGAIEGAVAALLDDDLVSSGGDLRIDLNAGLAVHQTGPAPDRRPQVLEAAHIAAIPSVGVGGVDDQDSTLAAKGNGTLESG